jgi:hypothetical protein
MHNIVIYVVIVLVIIFLGTPGSPCKSGTRTHSLITKPNFNSSLQLAVTQKRWASQATAKEDDSKISIGPRRGEEAGEDEKDTRVVYYGPISSTIKKVKLLSLSTCCLSVTSHIAWE